MQSFSFPAETRLFSQFVKLMLYYSILPNPAGLPPDQSISKLLSSFVFRPSPARAASVLMLIVLVVSFF